MTTASNAEKWAMRSGVMRGELFVLIGACEAYVSLTNPTADDKLRFYGKIEAAHEAAETEADR